MHLQINRVVVGGNTCRSIQYQEITTFNYNVIVKEDSDLIYVYTLTKDMGFKQNVNTPLCMIDFNGT